MKWYRWINDGMIGFLFGIQLYRWTHYQGTNWINIILLVLTTVWILGYLITRHREEYQTQPKKAS